MSLVRGEHVLCGRRRDGVHGVPERRDGAQRLNLLRGMRVRWHNLYDGVCAEQRVPRLACRCHRGRTCHRQVADELVVYE